MTETKTVLYLSYTGMTDPLGQSQVLAYLTGLSKNENYRFVIISFEKKAAYTLNREIITALCKEAKIEWHPLSYTAKPPVISTFRDVRRMRRKAKKIITAQSISFVHCRSYIPSLVGLYLKKRYGIPFLFDMRGFWADERIDGGIWKMSNPLYRAIYSYFKKKEKLFLLNADHTVSLTQNAKNVIVAWKITSEPMPITVIPCCADVNLFSPAKISLRDRQRALAELDIPKEGHIISYVGSLGTWYMLPEMMAFVKLYAESIPDVYFMVLTGEPKEIVYAAAAKAGLDTSFIRIKKLARSAMPLYISLSAMSIFFIKPAFSKKASSPVKQGELMAMGVPIICNDSVGDTAEIINEYDAGIVISEFTQEAYRNAIQTLNKTTFNRERIIEGAYEVYHLQRGVELYESVYKSLCND